MQCVLKEWHDSIESQQNNNHRFTLANSSPLNFFKSPAKPALYTFYSKFHESLIAKVKNSNRSQERRQIVRLLQFSLYFSDLLFEYGGNEARTAMTKTNPDYNARIAQFSRRSNVEWLVLLLHQNADERASHARFLSSNGRSAARSDRTGRLHLGVHFSDEQAVSGRTGQSFQIIYSYPNKLNAVRSNRLVSTNLFFLVV